MLFTAPYWSATHDRIRKERSSHPANTGDGWDRQTAEVGRHGMARQSMHEPLNVRARNGTWKYWDFFGICLKIIGVSMVQWLCPYLQSSRHSVWFLENSATCMIYRYDMIMIYQVCCFFWADVIHQFLDPQLITKKWWNCRTFCRYRSTTWWSRW